MEFNTSQRVKGQRSPVFSQSQSLSRGTRRGRALLLAVRRSETKSDPVRARREVLRSAPLSSLAAGLVETFEHPVFRAMMLLMRSVWDARRSQIRAGFLIRPLHRPPAFCFIRRGYEPWTTASQYPNEWARLGVNARKRRGSAVDLSDATPVDLPAWALQTHGSQRRARALSPLAKRMGQVTDPTLGTQTTVLGGGYSEIKIGDLVVHAISI